MATALTRPESGFVIGVTCPGCGGEVELQHDFFVTTCDHCGSVLRVLMPEATPAFVARPKMTPPQARAALDRYLKDSDRPLSSSNMTCRCILYPYWRIEAFTVKVRTDTEEIPVYAEDAPFNERESEARERRTVGLTPYSTSIGAGEQNDLIPATIGMRADYLKLYPMESDVLPDEYECVSVERDWASALSRAETVVGKIAAANTTTFGQQRTDLVYPRASLVFFPFLVLTSLGDRPMRAVVDSVAGRVVSYSQTIASGSHRAEVSTPNPAFGRIGLEFHRCAICGQDLPARASLVYLCPNCGRLTLLGSLRSEKVRCAEHDPSDPLIPFWGFRVSEAAPPTLIPAFRIANAEAMYRLSRRISGAASRLAALVELAGHDRLAPVTLDRAEAQAIADVLTYRKALEFDERARFVQSPKSDNCTLLFVPFRAEEYFYRDMVTGAVTFERALLKSEV
jgi:predicted RNA-binding Zn-ribbon protein involved in translation (DUF1610 family)/ribosomal protein S27E